jgi:hypothetical protein
LCGNKRGCGKIAASLPFIAAGYTPVTLCNMNKSISSKSSGFLHAILLIALQAINTPAAAIFTYKLEIK